MRLKSAATASVPVPSVRASRYAVVVTSRQDTVAGLRPYSARLLLQVSIALTGVNPELGQTLASTGLTVWRAAQEMARFMWEHRRALTLSHVSDRLDRSYP